MIKTHQILNWIKCNKILVCLIFLAVFIRFYGIGSESIWYDEAASIKIAAAPASEIISGEEKDLGNPPLFYTILHFWINIFGDSEVATRSLAAFLNILAMLLFYRLTTLLYDKKTAILGVMLFAISPVQIYLSQEVRTYTLSGILVMGSMLYFIKTIKTRRFLDSLAYSLFTLLAVLSHYYCFFIVLAQGTYVFGLILRQKSWPLLRRWFIMQFFIFASFLLIWGRPFISQLTSAGNLSRASATWIYHMLAVPIYFSVGRTLVWKDSSLFCIILIYLSVIIFFFIPFFLGCNKSKKKDYMWLLILWLTMPVLIPAAISLLFSPIYYSRYAFIAIPPFYIFIAIGLLSIKKKSSKNFILAGILILSLFSLFFMHHKQHKHDWRSAVSYISANEEKGDILLFDADIGETPFSYYYKGNNLKIRLLNIPSSDKTQLIGSSKAGGTKIDMACIISDAPRVWLIISDNDTSGAGDYYTNYFKREFSAKGTTLLRGITIYQLTQKIN